MRRIDVDIVRLFEFGWISVLGSVFVGLMCSCYRCVLIGVVVCLCWVKVGRGVVVFRNCDKGEEFLELVVG